MDISLSKLLEIVKDMEAWHAATHGITKSPTRLSRPLNNSNVLSIAWGIILKNYYLSDIQIYWTSIFFFFLSFLFFLLIFVFPSSLLPFPPHPLTPPLPFSKSKNPTQEWMKDK